ncbi:MAG: hypothetical protein NZ851_03895 [Aquificaceae bacterium]|nr:hypothetical protein [Aquificaceae bacterium]
MRRVIFLLAMLSLAGCEALRLENPCSSNSAKTAVKSGVAFHSWYVENPLNATVEISTKGIQLLFSGDVQKQAEAWLYSRLKDRMERTKVLDISKPKKIDAQTYRCSAIAELDGRKYGVVYTVEKFHSGREDYYRVELQEVAEVK